MDLTSLFLFCLISLVIGAVLMLIVQYYIYVRFCHLPKATPEQRNFNEKYALPEDVRERAYSHDPDSKSPLMALNLIMQFLFHELKHTTRVRKWFYYKLTVELDDLVTKTTTGKLFDKLTLKDLDLGDQFPEVRILRVHDVEIHETEGRIENLDLLLELKYTGNFRMAVDAVMVLGKKASLTLKVKHFSGIARLQFTRKPYTHWSISFLGDPELDLGIDSKFQGRQMQSNISSLISNQIRRAIRRKHTLPKYKIRYKPFFHRNEDDFDIDLQPNGLLEVKVSELSRLLIPNSNITDIYCTLLMGPLAWVEAKQKDDCNVLVSIDVEIHRAKNQQIGILFKQGDIYVEIEAVLPNTPAIKSNLKSGDTLIAIEGQRVNSIQQVAKVVKGLTKTVLVLRIERTIPGAIRSAAVFDDTEVYEDLGEPKPTASLKLVASPVAIEQSSPTSPPLGRRNNSSSESSITNTPTSSPKKTKFITKALKKTLIREHSIAAPASNPAPASTPVSAPNPAPAADATHGVTFREEPVNGTAVPASEKNESIEYFQKHTTIYCSTEQLINVNDLSRFNLDARTRYLNICVYGKSSSDSLLLGFLNIPIKNIIGEICETTLIQIVKTYPLKPPITQHLKSHVLSSLSGFNPSLCFGDILLAFSWDGSPIQCESMKKKTKSSSEKIEEGEKSEAAPSGPKAHNFVRTHFHRATQCDFCGKKIWLKDAVQCRDCSMICHKKCVTKCQNSTVCGPVDVSGVMNAIGQPEFTVTEAPVDVSDSFEDPPDDNEPRTNLETSHRQSLTGLIAQGLKRVNSANNLAIPGISQNLNPNSKSLPPSPQHSPRKQSLANQGVSPFLIVTQILESIPNDLEHLSDEQINNVTEPIISIGKDEDVMTMAKEASKSLFSEHSATERVDKINELLTKLRLALDSETANHSRLLETNPNENSIIKATPAENTRPQTSDRPTEADAGGSSSTKEMLTRRAFDLAKSEERVQALSVIMLYLCTGLQHAQGVASQ